MYIIHNILDEKMEVKSTISLRKQGLLPFIVIKMIGWIAFV